MKCSYPSEFPSDIKIPIDMKAFPNTRSQVSADEGSTTEVHDTKSNSNVHLVSCYDRRIRPLLEAVDRLRRLNVMKEGIQLPTIVVVGDQSSGKSSVLESLAGISLPRGQGICTRVPLIMRLQNHQQDMTELILEYEGKSVPSSENDIADAIVTATDEVAGDGKNISNTPLTLVVKKRGMADLTMVDLPGITRVPVYGQPKDIYEQISGLIMEYISPKESIILNVLSATVDFPTCESIRMSQRVDKTGERTLAVVTKVDKSPEGLLEKVTSDDVNIGLGYVCVRNRVGNDESYADARKKEAELFNSHHLLSKIDKSIVGIPVLAQRLTTIQASMLGKSLPDIIVKVNEKLHNHMNDLEALPKSLTNFSEAMTAFIRIVSASRESLKKLILRGEYDEFPDEEDMYCTCCLAEMLNTYATELHTKYPDDGLLPSKFLVEEIHALDVSRGIWLSNFPPRSVFQSLFQRKIRRVSSSPVELINKVWNYLEEVVFRIFKMHSDPYPQLHVYVKRAVHDIMSRWRTTSQQRVKEMIEMEKMADYTSNPEYRSKCLSLNAQQAQLMSVINNKGKGDFVEIIGLGRVNVAHLRNVEDVLVEKAFDMKMRVIAYWKIVEMRLVDNVALHLLFAVKKLVDIDLDSTLISNLVGSSCGVIETLLKESPSVMNKRMQLNSSIQLLGEAKDALSSIMDQVSLNP